MSRIVSAINSMISNPELIGNVITNSANEYFFTFKDRHKWSIRHIEPGYVLWYYPSDESLENLAAYDDPVAWEHVPMVTYRSADIGTLEAEESFRELYRIVGEKVFGMDEVLDDIIGPEF